MPDTVREDGIGAIDITDAETATEITRTPAGYPNRPIYNPDMKFRLGVIPALRSFKNEYPYSVGEGKRKIGMTMLCQALSQIYGLDEPSLYFSDSSNEHSFSSSYSPEENRIDIRGKLSIITFLHEFAHAMGKDEVDAVKWSLSLFKRVYPLAFARLIAQDHCLVENPNTGTNRMRRPNHPRQSAPALDTSRELTSVEILQLAQSSAAETIAQAGQIADEGIPSLQLTATEDTAIRTVDELVSQAMEEN